MSATDDPEPKRVYFRPPDDWDELTEDEQLAWAMEAGELIIAQANLGQRVPSPDQP